MTWIKLDDHILDDPKIIGAGEDAALLYIAGLCYASRHLTDGLIPEPIVARLTGAPDPDRLARALTDAGLWIEHPDHYEIHAYLEHQRSKADVERAREEDRQRKRYARAHRRRPVDNTPPADVTPGLGSESTRSPENVRPDTARIPGGVDKFDTTPTGAAKLSPGETASPENVRPDTSRTPPGVRSTETDTETEPDGIQGSSLTRSRMPDGFKPPPQMVQHLADQGWSARVQAVELPKFVDYVHANDKRVVDWAAAYSLWVRRSKPDQLPRGARFVCTNCGAEEAHCECGYDAEFTIETEGLG